MRPAGLLLAAGGGRRLGRPKATVTGSTGVPWVVSSAQVLLDAGCGPVLVTTGADGEAVRTSLAGTGVSVLDVPDWSRGLSTSLRAGLVALLDSDVDCCVVHLVDLPDVGPDVVERVAAAVGAEGLARATYGGVPGHPVAITRPHWAPLLGVLAGDSGAGAYLRDRGATQVECGDLARGEDVDTRDALTAWLADGERSARRPWT